MKLKSSCIIFLFTLLLAPAYTQSNELKLSDYALPDLNYRSLYMNFGMVQQNSKQVTPGGQVNYEVTPSSYSGNSVLYYQKFENNQVWQKELSTRADLSLSFNDQQSSNNSQYQKSSRINTGFTTSAVNRKYVQPRNFREINYQFASSFDWRHSSFSNNNGIYESSKPYEFDFIGFLPIKFGKGRIDQVTDARHAIFILEKLKEVGRLSQDLNEVEIREFAEMISTLNYTRYFDFRLRRIYELETIDSFLQSKNYISKTDITYFTNLNDRWIYGKGPLRYNGKRAAFAFYPGYNFLSFTNNDGIESAHTLSANMGFEYTLEKPIDLYWQNSFELYSNTGILTGKTKRKNSSYKKNFFVPKLSLGATDKLGFYPNTRTSIELSGGIHGTVAFGEAIPEDDKMALNGYGINISSALNIYYFISPRLNISISLNMNYELVKQYDLSDFRFDSVLSSNLLYFINYPQCESPYCYFYSSEIKRFSNFANISVAYDLF